MGREEGGGGSTGVDGILLLVVMGGYPHKRGFRLGDLHSATYLLNYTARRLR